MRVCLLGVVTGKGAVYATKEMPPPTWLIVITLNYFVFVRVMGQKSKLIIAKQKLLTSRLVYSRHRVGLGQPKVTSVADVHWRQRNCECNKLREKGKGASFLARYSRTPGKKEGNVSLRVGRGRVGTATGRLRKPVRRRAKPQDSLRY